MKRQKGERVERWLMPLKGERMKSEKERRLKGKR